MEIEINKTLECLDLSTQRYVGELDWNVYSNPTFTDTIILFNSCHPNEHNFDVPMYLISRLNNYQLKTAAKQKEIIYIQNYYTKQFLGASINNLQGKDKNTKTLWKATKIKRNTETGYLYRLWKRTHYITKLLKNW